MFGKKEKTIILNVNGMTCHHCEMTVEKSIKEINNITFVKADHKNSKVEIKYEGDIDSNLFREKITGSGYSVI